MAIDQSAARNDRQRRLLEVVRRWEDGYDNGVGFIPECYWPDASVYFTGGEAHGVEQFTKLEAAIFNAAPGRRMRVDRTLLCGDDVVVVEAAILDSARPEYFSPFCAILTFHGGKIIQDRTYLEPSVWPGIESTVGLVSPGGLAKAPELTKNR